MLYIIIAVKDLCGHLGSLLLRKQESVTFAKSCQVKHERFQKYEKKSASKFDKNGAQSNFPPKIRVKSS